MNSISTIASELRIRFLSLSLLFVVGGLRDRWLLYCALAVGCFLGVSTSSRVCMAQADVEFESVNAAQRIGYRVDVNLPLIGDRDDLVRRQIMEIAESQAGQGPRPIVVLNFRSAPISDVAGELFQSDGRTRGSQFERCLALARFLTSSDAARVRLIAYVAETVEGHAVLTSFSLRRDYLRTYG